MAQRTTPAKKHTITRKAAGFAGLTAAGIVGSAFFAAPAFAHHPTLTAAANCDGTVTFDSVSWSTGLQGTHSDLDVKYRVDDAAWIAIAPEDYHYDSANGYAFSDTISGLPAGWSDVDIVVTADGPWANGNGGGETAAISDIAPKTGCVTPPTPAVPGGEIGDADCVDGKVEITLTNTGQQDATFTVKVGDDAPFTKVVDASETFEVPVPEGVATPITISSGSFQKSETIDYDCTLPAAPAATLGAPQCLDEKVVVTLSNTGEEDAEFTITAGGQTITRTVGGGDSLPVPIPVPFDEVTEITITSGSFEKTATIDYDCAVPGASVAEAECQDGGTVITLTNDGDKKAVFTVSIDGQATDYEVEPGSSLPVEVDFPSGEKRTITVSSTGMDSWTETVGYACPVVVPPTTPQPPTVVIVEQPAPTFSAPPTIIPVPTVPVEAAAPAPAAPAVVEAPVAAPATAETPAPAAPGVLGAQVSAAPAGQLPRTGTGTEGIALAGFGSVLAGLGMTLAGRRRRQA